MASPVPVLPLVASTIVAPGSSRPRSSSNATKRCAAFIGPMVWELEGPIPIFNKSNTLIAMRAPVAGHSIQSADAAPSGTRPFYS